MTDFTQSITVFLKQEFRNELALFASLTSLGQVVYGFYALAAVLVIRPHIRQAMKYRHGDSGKGDFCHRAQFEAIFWRLAPLLYAFVIDSKLLALSVLIDIVGRLWTIYESHRAEKRFIESNRAMQLQQDEISLEGVDLVAAEVPANGQWSGVVHDNTVTHSQSCRSIPAVACGIPGTIYSRSGGLEQQYKYAFHRSKLELC